MSKKKKEIESVNPVITIVLFLVFVLVFVGLFVERFEYYTELREICVNSGYDYYKQYRDYFLGPEKVKCCRNVGSFVECSDDLGG